MQKSLTEIKKDYRTAWLRIKEEVKSLLLENRFTLKDSDIGNIGGEAYAYAVEMNDIDHPLYLIRIAPTATGKLKIKLTFNDKRERGVVADRIKAAISATPLAKPEVTGEGRFWIEYLL